MNGPERTYWVHDLSPFLIRFSGDFGIRYYDVNSGVFR